MACRIVLGHYIEAIEKRFIGTEDEYDTLRRHCLRQRASLLRKQIYEILLYTATLLCCLLLQICMIIVALVLFLSLLAFAVTASNILATLGGATGCAAVFATAVMLCRILHAVYPRIRRGIRSAFYEYRRIRSGRLEDADIQSLLEILRARRGLA
ncbi:MAG: hypothetical protein KDK78_05330 [Chlamydiia bacterium]|nr:hypothetical protein [Chlamydiia bacterium]